MIPILRIAILVDVKLMLLYCSWRKISDNKFGNSYFTSLTRTRRNNHKTIHYSRSLATACQRKRFAGIFNTCHMFTPPSTAIRKCCKCNCKHIGHKIFFAMAEYRYMRGIRWQRIRNRIALRKAFIHL